MQVLSFKQAQKFLKGLPKQIKFAEAQAINKTAEDARSGITDHAQRQYTFRSRGKGWWEPGNRFGFNIKFASKKQDVPEASVFTRADWLEEHETGQDKKGGEHRLAVPAKGIRKTPRSVIPKRMRPRALLSRQKRGKAAAFIRDGVIYENVRKGEIRRAYTLKAEVPIKPNLRFRETGSSIARKNFDGHFTKSLQQALATAR